jgi:hypothetical protein
MREWLLLRPKIGLSTRTECSFFSAEAASGSDRIFMAHRGERGSRLITMVGLTLDNRFPTVSPDQAIVELRPDGFCLSLCVKEVQVPVRYARHQLSLVAD